MREVVEQATLWLHEGVGFGRATAVPRMSHEPGHGPDVVLLHAAADPTRLAILRELSWEKSVCACDFTEWDVRRRERFVKVQAGRARLAAEDLHLRRRRGRSSPTQD